MRKARKARFAATTALVAAFFLPAIPSFADGLGVGVSIGGRDGVGAGLGVSLGGDRGIGAGLGASVGGRDGISAGAGASVGGTNGVTAGLGASIGGRSGVTAGAGSSIGGSGRVTAGLGANLGDGIRAGAGVGIGGGAELGVGISIGARSNSTTPTKPGVVVDRWRDPTGGTDTTGKPSPNNPGATLVTSRMMAGGMSAAELTRYKRRCVEILANSGGYDGELVSLCRAIRGI